MDRDTEGGSAPCDGCDACLDWRIAQTHRMGEHLVRLLEAVVSELGVDTRDPAVREVMSAKVREYSAGIES